MSSVTIHLCSVFQLLFVFYSIHSHHRTQGKRHMVKVSDELVNNAAFCSSSARYFPQELVEPQTELKEDGLCPVTVAHVCWTVLGTMCSVIPLLLTVITDETKYFLKLNNAITMTEIYGLITLMVKTINQHRHVAYQHRPLCSEQTHYKH